MNFANDNRYRIAIKIRSTGILRDLEPGEWVCFCDTIEKAREIAKNMSQLPNAVGRARVLDLQPDPRVVRW